MADVFNWPGMSGHGNTRSEALEDLRAAFDHFKATKKKLPRPGTKVPVEFAASDRVSRHSTLAKEFISRILELDWAWISDESTLSDFYEHETNGELIQKIQKVYGVDVSDVSDGNLADILDRIARIRSADGSSPYMKNH